jgi:hypothetical protein
MKIDSVEISATPVTTALRAAKGRSSSAMPQVCSPARRAVIGFLSAPLCGAKGQLEFFLKT